MASDVDSLDISMLKAMALALPLGPLNASPHKASSKAKDVWMRDSKSSRARTLLNRHGDGEGGVPRPKSAGGPKATRYSLSQPESYLPSTVPETVRTGRMSDGSNPRSGDTQPLSQSVYDAYQRNGGPSIHQRSQPSLFASQTQPGHLDLGGLFDNPDNRRDTEMEEHPADEITGLTQLDVRAELFPEANRFKQPKTPATNGNKRYRDGTLLHQQPETPSLPVNPFANNTYGDTGIMGLSQIFKATQAPSSPFVGLPPSDTISERPSPAMYIPSDRPQSSPARFPLPGLQRTFTEPQEKYKTMKESQEERERRIRLQAISSPTSSRKRVREDFDEDFDLPDTQLQRRLRMKKIEYETSITFENIRAKPRPGSRGAVRGLGTPAQPGRQAKRSLNMPKETPKGTVLISDDLQMDDASETASEEETERDEGGDDDVPDEQLTDELAEDNKENLDSRGVQVLRTAKKTTKRSHSLRTPQSSPLKQSLPKPDDLDELAADTETVASIRTIAIADSQPSQSTRKVQVGSKVHSSQPNSSTGSGMVIPHTQLPLIPNTSQIDSSIARQMINGSSQLSTIASTSGEPPSSPALEPPSSPTRRMNPRKPVHRSNNALSQDTPLVEAALASCSQVISEINESTIDLPAGNDPQDLPLPPATVATPTRKSKIHAVTDEAQFVGPNSSALRSTIPETSSAGRSGAAGILTPNEVEVQVSNTRSTTNQTDTPSRINRKLPSTVNSTEFETAQTHATPIKSRTQDSSRPSEPRSSPRKSTKKPRTFADIAALSSPPDELGMDEVDINLLTAEDIEFQKAMEGSSPINPAKRSRKIYTKRSSVLSSDQLSSSAPVVVIPSPRKAHGSPKKTQTTALDSNEVCFACETKEMVTNKVAEETLPLQPRKGTSRKGMAARLQERSAGNSLGQSKKPVVRAKGAKSNGRSSRNEPRQEGVDNDDQSDIPSDVEQIMGICELPEITSNVLNSNDVILPNRVFAHFNGSYAGYYPATCMGTVGGDEPKYRIRFDDGTIDVVNAASVKKLELRKGDTIKLDRPGARSHNFLVVGFENEQGIAETGPRVKTATRSTATDVFGHQKIVVRLKQTSRASSRNPTASETVPLSIIYLTTTLWKSIKDRTYTFTPSLPAAANNVHTPSDRPSTPVSPSSRTRRAKMATQPPFLVHAPSLVTRATSSIFDNVVFSITNIENPTLRNETVTAIRGNGGTLLSTGFDELFHIPESTSEDEPVTSFHLHPRFSTRGFICLLSDKHCRKQTFLQALALGIPCLATRWVKDCLAKSRLLPWEPYLLASGESSFLNTIRGRSLPSIPLDPEQVSLKSVINQRPKFLEGKSVLLVGASGRDGALMRAYPFIAWALGATRVLMVTGFEEAIRVVSGGGWDWVCYHEGTGGDKMGRKDVERKLFGEKKRKSRGATEEVEERRPKVMVTEYVVQSLILGRLVEE